MVAVVTKSAKFPVIFPVSREFEVETGSNPDCLASHTAVRRCSHPFADIHKPLKFRQKFSAVIRGHPRLLAYSHKN